MRVERSARAPRPLGLTLALVATAALYGVAPLLEVYFLTRLDATADEAFLLGGVTITAWTWLQGAFGALVLVICALAWWGRPPQIRFVLIALLLALTAIALYRVVEAARTPEDPIFGGQAQSALRDYLRCQLPGLVIVPLYVLWYLNRAPARAFYRRGPAAHHPAAPPASSGERAP
ncbi:MAG: hypothetical protein KJ047_10655 [Anaerolineae bacterium]|nr:hypothetical protein [Anaerolineae bacterium]